MNTSHSSFLSVPYTAVKVLTSPTSFFRGMPKTGGFIEPFTFVTAMGIISGIIEAVLGVLGLQSTRAMADSMTFLIILPLAISLGSFISAAFLFVIWKLMGSQEPYETAYRCSAYSSVLTPISAMVDIIPYLGATLSVILSTLFLVIASVKVHGLPSKKAWIVFGILGVLFIVMNFSGQCASRKSMGQAGLSRDMLESKAFTGHNARTLSEIPLQ